MVSTGQAVITRAELRRHGRKKLTHEVAGLETDLLLCHVLGCRREQLLARSDEVVEESLRTRFDELLERRMRGEPVAYILGHKEFYGREFLVDSRVLIPRPETEILVEQGVAYLQNQSLPHRIIDVGVGSGAVLFSIFLELGDQASRHQWVGVDCSEGAIAVSQRNARQLGIAESVYLKQGHLFDGLPLSPLPELIVSNPPYIAEGEPLPVDVEKYEPPEALWAGPEGFDIIEELMSAALGRLRSKGGFLCEIGKNHAARVRSSAEVEFITDLWGIERVLKIVRG